MDSRRGHTRFYACFTGVAMRLPKQKALGRSSKSPRPWNELENDLLQYVYLQRWKLSSRSFSFKQFHSESANRHPSLSLKNRILLRWGMHEAVSLFSPFPLSFVSFHFLDKVSCSSGWPWNNLLSTSGWLWISRSSCLHLLWDLITGLYGAGMEPKLFECYDTLPTDHGLNPKRSLSF